MPRLTLAEFVLLVDQRPRGVTAALVDAGLFGELRRAGEIRPLGAEPDVRWRMTREPHLMVEVNQEAGVRFL